MTKTIVDNSEAELKFLRYVYSRAYDALGPGAGDVYYYIRKEYKEKNDVLPPGYFDEDELEEMNGY